MTERITRRTVLGGVAGLGLAGLGLAAVPRRTAAAKANFVVRDATIETDDGTITGINVGVVGGWRFDGLDTDGRSVRIELALRDPVATQADTTATDATTETVATESWTRLTSEDRNVGPARAAQDKFQFSNVDLLAGTPWTVEDFAAPPEDGDDDTDEVKTTPLTLRLSLFVYDGRKNDTDRTVLVSDVETADFDVTVVNEPSTGGTDAVGTVHIRGDNEENRK